MAGGMNLTTTYYYYCCCRRRRYLGRWDVAAVVFVAPRDDAAVLETRGEGILHTRGTWSHTWQVDMLSRECACAQWGSSPCLWRAPEGMSHHALSPCIQLAAAPTHSLCVGRRWPGVTWVEYKATALGPSARIVSTSTVVPPKLASPHVWMEPSDASTAKACVVLATCSEGRREVSGQAGQARTQVSKVRKDARSQGRKDARTQASAQARSVGRVVSQASCWRPASRRPRR